MHNSIIYRAIWKVPWWDIRAAFKLERFPHLIIIMSTNHVFSAFSFISFVLASIPFAWHLKAWNTATCLYMFWVSISNFSFFVNSVVWDGNVVDWSPIWCDISKFMSAIFRPYCLINIDEQVAVSVWQQILRSQRHAYVFSAVYTILF